MKRKFTFLTAALMLLAFLAIPLGMRGQSNYSTDYTGNITLSTAGGTSASACKVVINNVQYDGIKAGTGSVNGAMKIAVPSGTKYLHIHAAAWNGNTVSLAVTPSGYSDNIALTANSGIANNSPFTFNGDPSTDDYYKVITFSSALTADTDLTFTAVGGKRFVIWGVTSEQDGGSPTPSITAANVDIDYDATSGAIEYIINNPATDGELTATTTSNWLTIGTVGANVPFTCSANDDAERTATVTLTYTYGSGNENVTKSVTVTQTANPNGPGSQANPYTVAQARAAIDANSGTQGVYATGIVSAIPTAYNSTYSNITFNMVDNTGDEEFLQAYRCGGTEAANVMVGDIVVVTGNLTKYGSTYEFAQGCEIVSLTHTVATHELTFSANPTEGGTVTVGTYTSPATIGEGTTVDITATPNTGYVFGGWTVTGTDSSVADATSATTTFTMGTANATLTANFTQVPTYTVTYYSNVTGTAPIEHTYSAGEDVTVANNTFANPGHAFSEWNTDPAGDGDPYSPGDVIQSIDANYDLYAQWIASNDATDVLNREFTGVSGTTYVDWSDKTGTSGTVYAGNSAGGNESIQLRTSSHSGIITTTSVGIATTVTVTWNSNTADGRVLDIYGKNTAYSSVDDLWGDNPGEKIGSITKGTNTSATLTGNYAYIGMRSNSGAMWLEEINITWNISGVVPPSITASNVEIAYDATSGEIGYTINNEPNPAGSLAASTTETWLTLGTPANGVVPFTCSANNDATARTATITLTYTYNTNETVTKDVTVTQAAAPVIYTTIPALFNAATSTATNVDVTFNNWTVTGVSTNGKNVFVTDGTNGFVIYSSSGDLGNTYTVGDVLSGTTTASLKLQNGFAQLTDVDATDLTIAAGGSIAFANIPMANLAGVNTGALVHYENLTCSVSSGKYYLSDGTTTLQVYNSLFAFEALVDGKTYNISGVYQQYNTTKEVLPRSAADIEEVAAPAVPSITLTPALVEATSDETEGNLAITLENIVITETGGGMFDYVICDAEGTALSDPTAVEAWLALDFPYENNAFSVYYFISENTTTTARTAYFKIYGIGDDGNTEAYSNIVTVTQAAYVAPPTPGNNYVKVTSTADLTDGQYLIVYEDGNLAFDGSLDPLDAVGNTISVTINNNEIEVSSETAASEFTIAAISDGYSIQSASGYYIGQTSDANGLASSDATIYTNAISFDEGNANVVSSSAYLRYNNASNQNRFRYYKSTSYTGQKAIQLYKKVVDPTAPSITVTPNSIAAEATGTSGTLNITLANMTISDVENQMSADFFNANGEPISGGKPDWIEFEFHLNGGVYTATYTIANNTTTSERNAYFKIYGLDDDGDTEAYSNLVSVTQEAYVAPVAAITLDSYAIDATASETNGTLTVTLENMTITDVDNQFSIDFFHSDGSDFNPGEEKPDWVHADFTLVNNVYSLNYTVDANTETTERNAYFKVYGLDDDGTTDAYSNLITVTQAAYVAPPTPGNNYVKVTSTADLTDGQYLIVYEEDGLAFDGSLTTLDAVSNTIPVTISNNEIAITTATAASEFTIAAITDGYSIQSASGYYIGQTSDANGLASSDEIVYTNAISFDEGNANIVSSGAYLRYNSTSNQARFRYYKSASYTGQKAIQLYKKVVDPNAPEITLSAYSIDATSAETDGNLTVTYKNIATDLGSSIYWFESDGTTTATEPNWMIAEINTTTLNVDYTIEENLGGERHAYFKVYGLDNNGDDVYSGLVTVTQAAYVPPVVMENYALFTGDLVEGDYIIYYNGKAMKNTVTSGRLDYAEVTTNNNVIATDDASIIWHIAPSGEYWTIYSADANAFAASTGAKNKAQMLADGTDDKALWTATGTEVYEFENKERAASSSDPNNKWLRNNGTYGFACYATSTGGALTLYKKTTTIASYDKTINAYVSTKDNYYLIASPVSANPNDVASMTEGTFDLYAFDQTQNGEEWRNYEAGSFYLTPGKGYLYAKNENITLTFNGMPYNGNGEISLDYTDGADFAGWNLIGNPFGLTASLDQPYYRLNNEGSALNVETESAYIDVMEGVFVQATASNQTASFTAQTRNVEHLNIAQANILVSQNGSTLDKAIVRFDNGSTLGKFQLNENSTKVYFTKNGQDYAIVNSDAQGEIPVNFKAEANGVYTLSFNAENVEFNYLHLIDNRTGNDVDLLVTPSYTFEGTKTDYASRFKLVFNGNNVNENATGDSFAFISDGNIIITGMNGDATMQMIDALGRTIVSRAGDVHTVSTNGMAPGVYVLRLINGNDVKTQKIVVK
ncbi:MAG: T9SS type A sorting domain-containing protein [Bacteroidales bacterium]|nr:T9SS type A sorting domain-containing protein [Bacteroidales bacterium]